MSVEVVYRPLIVEGPTTDFFCPRCERLCWQRIQRLRPGEAAYLRSIGRMPQMDMGTIFCKNGCSEMYSNWGWKGVEDRDVPTRLRQKLWREINWLRTRRQT